MEPKGNDGEKVAGPSLMEMVADKCGPGLSTVARQVRRSILGDGSGRHLVAKLGKLPSDSGGPGSARPGVDATALSRARPPRTAAPVWGDPTKSAEASVHFDLDTPKFAAAPLQLVEVVAPRLWRECCLVDGRRHGLRAYPSPVEGASATATPSRCFAAVDRQKSELTVLPRG